MSVQAPIAPMGVTEISLPSLNVRVFSVQSLVTAPADILINSNATGSNASIHTTRASIFKFSHEFISNENVAQQQTVNTYNVELTPNQFKCISSLLPAVYTRNQPCFKESQQTSTCNTLPPQSCILDKGKSPICALVPSLQLKIMFKQEQNAAIAMSQTTHGVECRLKQTTSQTTSQTASQTTSQNASDSQHSTHLFTACLPLKELLPKLITEGGIMLDLQTSEDNNTMWHLQLSVAGVDTLMKQDQFHSSMRQQIDLVRAHESFMQDRGLPCETLLQLTTALTQARKERKEACTQVLKCFAQAEMPVTWELQMSRGLGTAVTEEGLKPVKLCQQAIEELRIGAAGGDQSQQNFLLLYNCLASVAVKIAQEAGVQIQQVQHQNENVTVFDANLFHSANAEFVRQQGRQALMHQVLLKCQENVVSQYSYGSDPAYITTLQVGDMQIDATGKGHLDFTSKVKLSSSAGEDQSISIALGPERTGIFDCEDFANGIACTKSIMQAFNQEQFLQSIQHTASFFPLDVQQIAHTVTFLANELHVHVNENTHQATCMPNVPSLQASRTYVELKQLNLPSLQNAIRAAQNTNNAFDVVSACSILAKAPKIDNNTSMTSTNLLFDSAANSSSNSSDSSNTNAANHNELDLSTGQFFEYWSDPASQLNGHSVCVATKCSHVCWTTANKMPVVITYVSNNTDIIEGTGIARASSAQATQIATLQVANGQCSAQRKDLQRKLDTSACPLNVAMASNIKSSLHAQEITQEMKSNFQPLQTALDAMNKQSLSPAALTKYLQTPLQIPQITAIQSYSLAGKPTGWSKTTQAERKAMVNTMFYTVGLTLGDVGTLYSVEMCARPQLPNALASEVVSTDPAVARHEIVQNTQILPGTCFMRDLLNEDKIARITLAAPLSTTEKSRLQTAGAFLALNRYDAATYMQLTKSSFTPLYFRQALTLCPVSNVLRPLSASQMPATKSLNCGLFAKGAYVPAVNGPKYTTFQEIEANINALYTSTCNVIGSCPVITATGFSDSMVIQY
jgi:hypothetical protein